MKKIVLFAIAALTVSSSVLAQKGEFHLSIQAAPTVSWLSAPNDATVTASGSQFGVGLGVHGDYYFSDRYALTAGLVFSTNMGGVLQYNKSSSMSILGKTTFANDISEIKFGKGTKISYRNQFVEIPIGLKLHTEEVNGMRFFGNLPIFTLAFRTQSQGDILGTGSYTENGTPKADVAIDYKNENIGNYTSIMNVYVGGGAGVEYRLGETTTVTGGIFYQHGLIDATRNFTYTNSGGTDVTEDSNAQLSALSLRLGIMF